MWRFGFHSQDENERGFGDNLDWLSHEYFRDVFTSFDMVFYSMRFLAFHSYGMPHLFMQAIIVHYMTMLHFPC